MKLKKKRLNGKGQASIEAMVGFGILLALFAMVLAHNLNVSGSATLIEQKNAEQKECLQLAYLISELYSQGSGTRMNITLEKDANVISEHRVVVVGQQQCMFLANADDATIPAGTLIIENQNQQVGFDYA